MSEPLTTITIKKEQMKALKQLMLDNDMKFYWEAVDWLLADSKSNQHELTAHSTCSEEVIQDEK